MQVEKSKEVIYKYYLPEHLYELKIAQKADEFHHTLWEIYNECRNVWKYMDDAPEQMKDFAEKIGEMVTEAGVLEIV